MTRGAAMAAILLALAEPRAALAQDGYAPMKQMLGEIMQGCLANSQDREDDAECASMMTQVCISSGPGHYTTYGLNSCTGVLYELWDDELNRLWPQVLALGTPEEAEALRVEQRAWIAERNAECDAAAAETGGQRRHLHAERLPPEPDGGTGGGVPGHDGE